MRRKDREITDILEIEKIMQKAQVCHLGLAEVGEVGKPYIVPMIFGFKNRVLYLHSAKEGKKIDLIKQNNQVCFAIDIDHRLVLNTEEPAKSTMLYKSVMGSGKAYFIEDEKEKTHAMDIIMRHYTGDESYCGNYTEALPYVSVIKIIIDELTGKANQ